MEVKERACRSCTNQRRDEGLQKQRELPGVMGATELHSVAASLLMGLGTR